MRLLPRNLASGATLRSRKLLCEGAVALSTGAVLPYDSGRIWEDRTDRSLARRLHGFTFVADWFGASDTITDEESIRLGALGFEMFTRWHRDFGSRSDETSQGMAYHDETTAQRLLALITFLHCFGDALPASSVSWVRRLADTTADLLSAEEFYAGCNNHGMFQDISVLAYSILLEQTPERRRSLIDLTTERLSSYFESCFTSEGVHIENTPTYHVMVCRSLEQVTAVLEAMGAENVDRYRRLLRAAEQYALHAISPNGEFPLVSDTIRVNLDTEANRLIFRSPEFEYAASRGARGRMPSERQAIFQESGYAIVRSDWNDADASYLYFSAAYNADYHKHSDEMSIYVRAHGADLLAESGPYGFNWTDPLTRYAFSSYAHNTLVVGGEGLPRTGADSRATTLTNLSSDKPGFDVVGRTTRYPGVDWSRRVSECKDPSRRYGTYAILDTASSESEQRYSFLWHLGPEVEPVLHAECLELYVRGEKVGEFSFDSASKFEARIVHQDEDLEFQAWRFPAMNKSEPGTALLIELVGREVSVEYDLRFDNFRYRDRGLSKEPWRRADLGVPLNYVLDMPDGHVSRLIVVFTAMSQRYDFTYQYRRTLQGGESAVLYIVDDFGDQGSYYYSRNRDTSIYDAVQRLVESKRLFLGLDNESVVMVGSSKGGAAALIHGLGANVGSVIVGAPQTQIGKFVSSAHPNVLEYMSGGLSDSDVSWANGIIRRQMRMSAKKSKVVIVVGDADHHYKDHVLPFVRDAKKLGLECSLQVLPGVPHSRMGPVYARFLASWVKHWAEPEAQLPHSVSVDPASGLLYASVMAKGYSQISMRLYRGNELVESRPYDPAQAQTFRMRSRGRYRVRFYCRANGDQIAFTSDYVAYEAPVD